MIKGLIVDGVTGTGKTHTLAALARCEARPAWLRDARVFSEEETLGEFMAELRDPSLTDAARCRRLTSMMELLHADARADASSRAPGFVFERFHPSYYALLPRWELYALIDEALARHAFRLVLLTVPEPRLRERSLYRKEETPQWAEDMIAYFGSEAQAMDGILLSQRRRQECLSLTRLPSLTIDTSAMEWDAYAARIAAFCDGAASHTAVP